MKKVIIGTLAVVLIAGAIAFATGSTNCTTAGNCPEKCQQCCDNSVCCSVKK